MNNPEQLQQEPIQPPEQQLRVIDRIAHSKLSKLALVAGLLVATPTVMEATPVGDHVVSAVEAITGIDNIPIGTTAVAEAKIDAICTGALYTNYYYLLDFFCKL